MRNEGMGWALLITFLTLYVVISILTVLSLFSFSDSGPLLKLVNPENESKLTTAFVLEISGAIIALWYAIFGLKKQGSTPAPFPPKTVQPLPKNGFFSPTVSEAIEGAVNNLKKSPLSSEPSVSGKIEIECVEFRRMSRDWAEGKYIASGADYIDVLVAAYKTAETGVFSTCDPDYAASTWNYDLGTNLINAHKENGNKVTRVFIFDKWEQINDGHVEVMRTQAQISNIDLYVYIDEETELKLIKEINKDFTLIDDGRIIGVTEESGQDKSAIFHFNNIDLAASLQTRSTQLVRHSQNFEDFHVRWLSSKPSNP